MALLLPQGAHGHAFGQRYDLPLPLELYLWSAGITVLVSFVIAARFIGKSAVKPENGVEIGRTAFGRILQSGPVTTSLKLVSLALFILVVASGLIGVQSPTGNFAPTFVWVIWWVGMTYLVALLGNLWDLFNPWRILFDVAGHFYPRLERPLLTYPQNLGKWPALTLFLAFCYLEFISSHGEQPRTLAILVLIYSAITVTGMKLFGRDTWLANGETFTVLFGLLSRFGIFTGDAASRSLRLDFPGAGLHNDKPVSISLMFFVLLMVTTVSFDGVIETPLWAYIVEYVGENQGLRGPLLFLQDNGINLLQFLKILVLAALYLGVIAVYFLVSAMVSGLSKDESISRTARLYILSLIPIALAYHLAHYFSYLLLAGQLIIPLSSDPFGFGWDMWGTAGRSINVAVVSAKDVWYVSVCAIVAGHVIAVYLAHATALRDLEDRRRAVVSQLPMLCLMVGYTMLSLWILSQPIVSA